MRTGWNQGCLILSAYSLFGGPLFIPMRAAQWRMILTNRWATASTASTFCQLFIMFGARDKVKLAVWTLTEPTEPDDFSPERTWGVKATSVLLLWTGRVSVTCPGTRSVRQASPEGTNNTNTGGHADFSGPWAALTMTSGLVFRVCHHFNIKGRYYVELRIQYIQGFYGNCH